jgi:phosphate transport system protein
MERRFDQQIEKLKTRLIKMCSLVDEQVEFAIKSVEEDNLELANIVIERDKKVDKYDVKIEKICQRLFALNQPVAMDLRLIMSSLTINHNLERIGDLATNIAKDAEYLKNKPEFYKELGFKEISTISREMVRFSIDSFIDNNPKLAEKVISMDDGLDNLTRSKYKLLVDIMKRSPENIDAALKFYSIFHDLERLGDHATNIAEDVFFIVEAQLIKHRYEGYLFNEEKDVDKDLDLEA